MVWIEKLDIAAFGGISGKSYSFTRGINVITAANECGKTTIIAAIRFALYGFTGAQHSITENHKKRYMPWSGAAASVALTLGGDKRLRIERSVYGNKETALCTELNTGLPLYAGKVFGEEILGIGADTADKTLFFATVNPHQPKDEPLAEALQGLMFSADEQISGDKAIKALNSRKNALAGKNGVIPRLELESQQLEEQQRTVQASVKELAALEQDIKRTSAALEEKESALKKAEAERDNLMRYRAAQALAEYRAAADRRKKAAAALNAFDKASLTMEHIDLCNSLKDKSAAVSAQISDLRTRLAQTEAELAEDEGRDLLATATRCRAKRRWALILWIIAVLLIAAGVGVYMASLTLAAVALWVAGAACGIGALGFTMNSANTVSEAGYPSLSALEQGVAQLGEKSRRSKAQIHTLKASLAGAEVQQSDLQAQIKAAGADGDTGEMVKDLLALNALKSESNAAEAAFAAIKARYDPNELERLATGAVKPEKTEEQLETEYRFANQGACMLRDKLQPMLARRIALQADNERLAAVEERLAWCNTRLNTAKEAYAALLLAMEELTAAGNEMKMSIAPRVADKASVYLSAATAGKYSALELDTRLYPAVECENGVKSAEYLSAGARDVLYLSMRLAYIGLIYGNGTVPLLLDDAFCRTDNTRLSTTLSALRASGNQLLITSCTDREEKALSALGAEYRSIRL